jgi:hypothetical protein
MINKNKRYEIESEIEKALEKIREVNKKKSEKRGKRLIKKSYNKVRENFSDENKMFFGSLK